ncbi:hypothetical protein WMF27_32990 [Sorangium sp. So ce281]|uniref:hypothetical protein n=1 Tax=unclassified Sorangium TaxID=2621164 RepID=UPI003F619514
MASKSALLAKYNAAGNHVWSKQFGVEGTTTGEAVALDASGAVIATGNCEGAVDLGGGLFTPTAWSDVWVAKYDAGGNHLWSKRFDAEWPMGSRSVAVDGDGNVILGGALSGTTDFGGGPVVSLGDFISSDAFIAKLDAAGNHLWSRSFGDVDRNDHVSEIVPDGAGDVFVIGDWAGSIDLGGGSLVSDDVAIFVAKLSATGAHLWSRRLSATGNIDPRRGAVDSAGNLFLTGGFSGTVDFGGRPLVSAGGEDVFLVELGPDGAHRFSARWGSAANENGMAVRVDGAGNLVMAGNHDGPLDFGGGPLVSAGEKDIFLARLSPRGAHIQSAGFGGPQHQVVFGAALDADGQPYLTGYFSGSVTFGASTLTSKGHDIFLAKFR